MSTKEIAVTVDYGYELRFESIEGVLNYVSDTLIAEDFGGGSTINIEVYEYDE